MKRALWFGVILASVWASSSARALDNCLSQAESVRTAVENALKSGPAQSQEQQYGGVSWGCGSTGSVKLIQSWIGRLFKIVIVASANGGVGYDINVNTAGTVRSASFCDDGRVFYITDNGATRLQCR